MSDTTAAATLAENDRQAAELARYVEHKDEVMGVLALCAEWQAKDGFPRVETAILALLARITGSAHDVDECEDRECAVCSEYHGGRDDGGSCQDEDSRFAPLINPEKERAKLAQRETP